MLMAGLGVVFLAISNSTQLVQFQSDVINYVASAGLVISRYVYYHGIYTSAVSVSVDNTLRNSVRRQLALIGSIGTEQLQQAIEKTILKITKEKEETLDLISTHYFLSGVAKNYGKCEMQLTELLLA